MSDRWFLQRITRPLVMSASLAWAALLIFGCPAGKEDDFVVGTPNAAQSVGERLFLGKRSDCQNRTLAIMPSDGIPCRHGYASLITPGTLGTDSTGNPRPH